MPLRQSVLAMTSLLLVSLAFAAVADPHRTADPADPADTKVCRNSGWDFQFAYPAKWQVYYPSRSAGAADRPPITLKSCDDTDRAVTVAPGPSSRAGFYIDVCSRECMKTTIYADSSTLAEFLVKHPVDGTYPDARRVGLKVAGQPAVSTGGGETLMFHHGAMIEFLCFATTPPRRCKAIVESIVFDKSTID